MAEWCTGREILHLMTELLLGFFATAAFYCCDLPDGNPCSSFLPYDSPVSISPQDEDGHCWARLAEVVEVKSSCPFYALDSRPGQGVLLGAPLLFWPAAECAPNVHCSGEQPSLGAIPCSIHKAYLLSAA